MQYPWFHAVADRARGTAEPLGDAARAERSLVGVLTQVGDHQAVEPTRPQALRRSVVGRLIDHGILGRGLLAEDGRVAIGEFAFPLPATGGALHLAGLLQGAEVLAGAGAADADRRRHLVDRHLAVGRAHGVDHLLFGGILFLRDGVHLGSSVSVAERAFST
jgi:hypothetical protein